MEWLGGWGWSDRVLRPIEDLRMEETRPMKAIDLSSVSPELALLLEQARDDDLVLRLADGSEFLVVAIDDFDEEIARTRNHPRLMALLEARARQTATIPLDEVKKRLGL
jgi:hypothetical protein